MAQVLLSPYDTKQVNYSQPPSVIWYDCDKYNNYNVIIVAIFAVVGLPIFGCHHCHHCHHCLRLLIKVSLCKG